MEVVEEWNGGVGWERVDEGEGGGDLVGEADALGAEEELRTEQRGAVSGHDVWDGGDIGPATRDWLRPVEPDLADLVPCVRIAKEVAREPHFLRRLDPNSRFVRERSPIPAQLRLA